MSRRSDHDDLVRSLLRDLPDPGPMPDDLVTRITTRLREEHRAGRGAVVRAFPLPDRRPPSRRFVVGLVAAAAAAAIGGVLGVDALRAGGTPAVVAAVAGPLVHHRAVDASGTAYTADEWPDQAARAVARSSGSTTTDPERLGPFASSGTVDACLDALGLDRASAVHVDVATFDARPAAVVTATRQGERTARVVGPGCGSGNASVLAGPVTLP